jgi:hypothetical protein
MPLITFTSLKTFTIQPLDEQNDITYEFSCI